MTVLSTIVADFLGSFVEVAEAFTIILAVGVRQCWRPAFVGTALALAGLTLVVLLFGPLLGSIPIEAMQLVIWTLLILFGLRWLRKAILRASGFLALHDEGKAFASETAGLRLGSPAGRADFLAGVAAFEAVLLEGVEVVFSIVATGAGRGMIGYASLGALATCVLVLAIGPVVRKPLSTVPENSLKFVVGLLLSAFGIFWVGKGSAPYGRGRTFRCWRSSATCRSSPSWRFRRCGAGPPCERSRSHDEVLEIAFAELVGMFVDNGALALSASMLILVLGVLVKLDFMSGTAGAVVLGVGCLAILAESLLRVARRKPGGRKG